MKPRWICICIWILVTATVASAVEGRWESAIRRFEMRDKQNPPAQGQVLMLGSSSIRGWDNRKWFPDVVTLNRGFGGSQIADSLQYADRIVLPYRPRLIVFYAGDNDVAAKKTPQRVFDDYKALVDKVARALPRTRWLYVAIKPSLSRWHLWPKMREANELIEAYCRGDERLTFVDIGKPMLGPDGRPRKELFKRDGLHLNEAGYELWTSRVGRAAGLPHRGMKIEKECFIWYEGPLPVSRAELLAGVMKAVRVKAKSKAGPRVEKVTVRVVDAKTKKAVEYSGNAAAGKLEGIRGAGTVTICLTAPAGGEKEAKLISNVLTLPVVLGP